MLLPGFISFGLAQYITDMGDFSEFQLTFYSFGLTLVNLSLAIAIYKAGKWLQKKLWQPRKGTGGTQPDSQLSAIFVLIVLVVSCAIGILVANFYENDTILKWLRGTPVTRMTTKRSYQRPLTFLLAQNRKGKLEEGRPQSMKTTEAWVEVHLTSGEVFEGYPEFFSMGNEATEIFLSPACKRIKKNGCHKVVAVSGPGILIFERDIKFIEFIDRQKSECHNLWKKFTR
jgi:hypothetical protein